MERWESGRFQLPAKQLYLKRVPRVRIPPSPQIKMGPLWTRFYCCYAQFLKDPVTQIETDGYCMACDEGGTDCDWDMTYSCYSTEDVCLYDY